MNLKELIERRNALAEEANAITETAANEVRALTDEEKDQHTDLMDQIRALDETIDLAKNAVDIADYAPVDNGETENRAVETDKEIEKREIHEFAEYIRASANGDIRANENLTKGANGAVIPSTIANMIITQVVEISPIYAAATKFNVKGTFSIPYYDETTDSITVEWANEFEDNDGHSGKFASISLTGNLARAKTLISKSLLNNSDFDLVSFMVGRMAEAIAVFIEKKLLYADADEKVDGLKDVKIKVETAGDNITADDLIRLQDSIRDNFQPGAFWIMNRETRTAIRLLKDKNERYMLNEDITAPFGYTLLGKPVYTSDAMLKPTAGKPAIYYGDFSGLAVKEVESPEIQILNELYAPQHAIGLLTFMEFDSKIFDAQRIAVLNVKEGV